ncbi:unnamed protein product [Amoebophrya sp. A25]|nr:unnamed protein product [Amoebophrya sp. A25]|eukprot:GSA25T00021683001.1
MTTDWWDEVSLDTAAEFTPSASLGNLVFQDAVEGNADLHGGEFELVMKRETTQTQETTPKRGDVSNSGEEIIVDGFRSNANDDHEDEDNFFRSYVCSALYGLSEAAQNYVNIARRCARWVREVNLCSQGLPFADKMEATTRAVGSDHGVFCVAVARELNSTCAAVNHAWRRLAVDEGKEAALSHTTQKCFEGDWNALQNKIASFWKVYVKLEYLARLEIARILPGTRIKRTPFGRKFLLGQQQISSNSEIPVISEVISKGTIKTLFRNRVFGELPSITSLWAQLESLLRSIADLRSGCVLWWTLSSLQRRLQSGSQSLQRLLDADRGLAPVLQEADNTPSNLKNLLLAQRGLYWKSTSNAVEVSRLEFEGELLLAGLRSGNLELGKKQLERARAFIQAWEQTTGYERRRKNTLDGLADAGTAPPQDSETNGTTCSQSDESHNVTFYTDRGSKRTHSSANFEGRGADGTDLMAAHDAMFSVTGIKARKESCKVLMPELKQMLATRRGCEESDDSNSDEDEIEKSCEIEDAICMGECEVAPSFLLSSNARNIESGNYNSTSDEPLSPDHVRSHATAIRTDASSVDPGDGNLAHDKKDFDRQHSKLNPLLAEMRSTLKCRILPNPEHVLE